MQRAQTAAHGDVAPTVVVRRDDFCASCRMSTNVIWRVATAFVSRVSSTNPKIHDDCTFALYRTPMSWQFETLWTVWRRPSDARLWDDVEEHRSDESLTATEVYLDVCSQETNHSSTSARNQYLTIHLLRAQAKSTASYIMNRCSHPKTTCTYDSCEPPPGRAAL